MPKSPISHESGLDHVVIAGGTPSEWLSMTQRDWQIRLENLADGAAAEEAHWISVFPHHGPEFSDDMSAEFAALMGEVPGVTMIDVAHGTRYVWRNQADVNVIVDPSSDGHQRFAATVEGLRTFGTRPEEISEEYLSKAILDPATQEADLVVVLGPPDRIPDSMVWELAYSELVFIDIAWGDLNANHIELAIDDFNRRHRRFGGLDS